jgi:hypothetical protein
MFVDMLYLFSAGLTSTYWSSYVYVVTDWTLFQWTIYNVN